MDPDPAPPDHKSLEKFNGKNFHLWKFKAQMYLEREELWGYVSGEFVAPVNIAGNAFREWKKKDRKAFAIISLALDDAIMATVRGIETSSEAWARLENQFGQRTMTCRLFLRKQLYATKMEEQGDIIEHINRLRSLADELRIAGTQISDEELVTHLLCSLPPSFEHVVTSLESRGDGALNWEFVTGRLIHEVRKREANAEDSEKGIENALLAKKSAVGSLMYAAIATRPDLAYVVGVLSQHLVAPGKEHWAALKQVLGYVKGTIDFRLHYSGQENPDMMSALQWYVDADWAGNKDNRRSTTGYLFKFCGNAVCWRSKLQELVTLSCTEAEYVSLCHATQELVWLRRLLSDLGFGQKDPSVMFEDNQGCLALAKNPIWHNRTKHIDVKYHFIREKVLAGEVKLEYLPTDRMVADTFTKGLAYPKFCTFRKEIGIAKVKILGALM